MTTPIPIYILTGYLGTGKTTLLKPLLQHFTAQGRKAAVLMNEIGSVSVDTLTLQGSGVPVLDLLDGCVCCTLQGSLGETLIQLIDANQPDVVFLETTGVASPVDLIASLQEPALQSYVELAGVFTLVSSRRFPLDVSPSADLEPNERTMIDQVQYADALLLTKTDMVSAEKSDQIEAILRSLNDHAPIFRIVKGNIPPEILFKTKKIAGKGKPSGRPKILSRGRIDKGIVKKQKKTTSFGNITTLYHEFSGPVDASRFKQLLRTLPEAVVRAKGFFIDAKKGETYEFQYESGALVITLVEGFVLEQMFAIFIGEQLDELEDMLRKLEM
jgi:G3E family GTPase